ncbi:MAG: hypothetical protein O8C61_04965 [Candidatus Methanoperedens sp.]|nr:hypothetical protein [Candidatus Methanoperedens sp.]
MNDDVKTRIGKLVASAADIGDPLERSRKYKNIVALISQEAARSNDLQDIEEAKKIAGLVADDPSKAYLEIVRAIAKMNRKDKNLFDEAVKITGKIDNDLDLSVALSQIVTAFGKYGITKKDDMIYSDSLGLIEKIPFNTYRAMAYRNISKEMAGIDQGKSLELLDRSIDLLENSKGIKPEYLVKAFCETSSILSLLNDERSRGFINKAIEISSEIVDDFDRSAVLLKIVETEIEIGTRLNDQELIKEAAVISKGITKEYYKTLATNSLESKM